MQIALLLTAMFITGVVHVKMVKVANLHSLVEIFVKLMPIIPKIITFKIEIIMKILIMRKISMNSFKKAGDLKLLMRIFYFLKIIQI